MITLFGSAITMIIVVIMLKRVLRKAISRYIIFRTESGILFIVTITSLLIALSFAILFAFVPTKALALMFYKFFIFFFRLTMALAIVFLESILRRKYSLLRAILTFAIFGISSIALLINSYEVYLLFGVWERAYGPYGEFAILELLSTDALAVLMVFDISLLYRYTEAKLKNVTFSDSAMKLFMVVSIAILSTVVLSFLTVLYSWLVNLYLVDTMISMVTVALVFLVLITKVKYVFLLGISKIIAIAVIDTATYSMMFYREYHADVTDEIRNIISPLVITIDWMRKEFDVGTTALDMGRFVALLSLGKKVIVAMFVDNYSDIAEGLAHVIRVQIENAIDYAQMRGLNEDEAKWRVAKIEIYNILEPILI